MNDEINTLTERFDKSLRVLMQNLGPGCISRADLGLTPGQVFMLHFIRKEQRCSVKKLAEKMEVASSAITVMLDRLENHGFVTRARTKEDRRVVMIELTEAGAEKLNFVMKERKKILSECFTQMESNELEPFINSLEKLASIAQNLEIK